VNDPLAWGAAGALLGAIVGSFVATLVLRWPEGRGMDGRSACDYCDARLRWFELIPLFSFLSQRGRCRRCEMPIAAQHFVIELLCALAGGLALWRFPGIDGAAGAIFGWLLVALGALDFRHFWLPDRLTLPLALTGIAGGLANLDPPAIDRLIGGIAGFALLWAIGAAYRVIRKSEGLGAGDPKLFSAIGLWTGWQALPLVLLGASAAGLGMALVLMLRQRVTATTRLPLGTLLAAAAFPVWLFRV
jgi:leader peptidase (prepilin peptidase) / N-methyltransferase